MRLKLADLQESDKKTQKIRAKDVNRYKELDGIMHYQGLLFIHEII